MQFFLPVRTDAGPVSAVFHQLFCPNPDSARKRNDTQKAHDSAALAVINGLILKQQHLSVLYPAASGKANGTLSPNPDNLTSEAAIITSAAAGTADRVIAYFDKEVNAEDFMKDGYPDLTKFDCEIRTGLDSAFTNTTGDGRAVVAILPVANEPKALEILVDRPLVDNANASVKFKDKRTKNNGIDTTNTVNFRLADAREPSVLAVESSGTRKIEITFSEAVLSQAHTNGNNTFVADNLQNYLIDGRPLEDYGITVKPRGTEIADSQTSDLKRAEKDFDNTTESFNKNDGELQVQIYSVKDKKGTDSRHKVTITVGSGHVLAAGTHMLTVRNVGDWAAKTDQARNSVSTQVLPFTVTENAEKPEFTVNIQSPEQYELNFNTAFKVVDSPSDRFKTLNSADNASVLQLQEYVNGAWKTISNGASAETTTGQNPVAVSRLEDTKYLVEVRRDWSDVYNFNSTRTDYYNKRLRLHVDAGKLVNVSNNLRNDEINIELNASDAKVTGGGEIMSGADLTSPTITSVTQAVANNGTLQHSWNVELSEPVKISSTANKEGLTPSQRQQAGVSASSEAKLRENQGVPVAFARFVNVNNPAVIVEGIVDENAFIDAEDKVINVEPESRLSGGDWRLVVGSVSDDYGSTLATDGQVITVDETTAVTDFKVVWAAVSQSETYNEANMGNVATNPQRGSYVFVKFNKAVDLASALNENNYALNNQPLPQGASIQANIKGYDDHDNTVDSVTIVLPTGSNLLYTQYTVDTLRTQLSINGVVAQGTGEVLSGSGMNQLPYNVGEYTVSATDYSSPDAVKIPGRKDNVNYVTEGTDAVWGNDVSEKYGTDGIKTWTEYYEKLRSALDNDQYRKVVIQKEAFDHLTAAGNEKQFEAARAVFGKNLIININRAVDVDFKGAVLNGNIVVSTTDAADSMTISNVDIMGTETEIRGNNASLTVNAGVVQHFIIDNVNVYTSNDKADSIVLTNVWKNSFEAKENCSINSRTEDYNGRIRVTDADGFGFRNDARWNGALIISSNGEINLKGAFANTTITLEQAATLNLGTSGENGSVTLDDAQINLNAPEAKVMVTQYAGCTANKEPDILIAGKDVKVYCYDTDRKEWLHDAGGSIITIDSDGKTQTDNSLNDYIQKDENNGGMKKFLDELDIVSDEMSYNDIVVSPSAIFGEGITTSDNGKIKIDRAKAADKVAEEIAAAANRAGFKNTEGAAVSKTDIKAVVSLSNPSNAKLFSQNATAITSKDEPASAQTDIIVITLTYAGNTYTRNIKITK